MWTNQSTEKNSDVFFILRSVNIIWAKYAAMEDEN